MYRLEEIIKENNQKVVNSYELRENEEFNSTIRSIIDNAIIKSKNKFPYLIDEGHIRFIDGNLTIDIINKAI